MKKASPTCSDRKVPSYAQPTAASESRRMEIQKTKPSPVAQKQPNRAKVNDSKDKVKEDVPEQTRPTGYIATYKLSTITSRGKAKQQAPFRFLDLPGELRNIVYEFCAESEPLCQRDWYYMDFTEQKPNGWPTGVPALSQTNRQLFYESAFWSMGSGSVDIVVRRSELSPLRRWLSSIGEKGRDELRWRATTICFRDEHIGTAVRCLPVRCIRFDGFRWTKFIHAIDRLNSISAIPFSTRMRDEAPGDYYWSNFAS